MLCSLLYSICNLRLLLVSSITACIDLVTLSAYIITKPSAFLAVLPATCINERSLRKNPSLSASRIATNETSGKSKPSLNKFTPTITSKVPIRNPLIISTLSSETISEWIYVTFICKFCKYSAKSSAILLVNVVINTLSCFSVLIRISWIKSSI